MTAAAAVGPQRILAIHRYYWPDTPPYASLLREIVRHWSDAGHDVTVFSTQPSYKPELGLAARPRVEDVDGTRVRRIKLPPDRSGHLARLMNVIRFPLAVFFRVLFGPKADVVMCSTAPPVLLGFATALAAKLRRSRFVYHCMDLHPEIGALSGDFSNPAVYRILRWMDTWACRQAVAVVVLSGDMVDALAARAPELAERAVVINNFDLPDYGEPEPSPVGPTDQVRLVFAGNLGRFQGLEELTAAVLDPAIEGIELVLMGEGAAKDRITELVAAAPPELRDRVVCVPHGSVGAARALVRTADYGVVSLAEGVIRYAYPSKTATYLAEGTPVLALVETDSELARRVVDGGYGFAVAVGDAAGLIEVLQRLGRDRHEQPARAAAATRAWQAECSAETLIPRWGELLELVGEAK